MIIELIHGFHGNRREACGWPCCPGHKGYGIGYGCSDPAGFHELSELVEQIRLGCDGIKFDPGATGKL